MPDGKKEIKVEYNKDIMGGVYANTLNIMHTPEEFILDFYIIAPPSGVATARVITSPGHMKRILSVLQENITKYEEKYGKIRPASSPERNSKIGFHPKREL